MTFPISEDMVRKVIQTVDQGLSMGLGTPKPGQMCVEAAVCYALGLEHSDDPACVDFSLRAYKIKINDSPWISKKSRGKGLRRIAVLQLGTYDKFDTDNSLFDRTLFLEKMLVRHVNTILRDAVAGVDSELTERLGVANNSMDINLALARRYADRRWQYAPPITFYQSLLGGMLDNACLHGGCIGNIARYASERMTDPASGVPYFLRERYAEDILLQSVKIAEDVLIEMNVPGVKWLPLLDEVYKENDNKDAD